MNTYIINTFHKVYLNGYKKRETEQVNSYSRKAEIKAENVSEAIQKYFEKELYFEFSFENACVDHREFNEPQKNILHYSVLVDIDNNEATKKDIEAWGKDEIKLYLNNIYLTIHELIPVEI